MSINYSALISPDDLIPVAGPAALNWANTWSEATEARYQHQQLRTCFRRILDTDDRIPYVSRHGQHLYNFWRDAQHVRGVWRRTSLGSYLSTEPEWEVLLDVDLLADQEGEDWVWKGAAVRKPASDRALVLLSRGGADATVVREFSLDTMDFVADGFVLPEAKTSLSWVDADTLLVGTEVGEGSLTHSGYPAQVRVWRRGEAIEQAAVWAVGQAEDVLISAHADPRNGRITLTRAVDFYSAEVSIAASAAEPAQRLDIPSDCDAHIEREWLLLHPRTDFAGIPAGGLGIIALDSFLAGQRDVEVLFRPTPQTSLQGFDCTRNYLVLSILHNVASAVQLIALEGDRTPREIELPAAADATVVATSPLDGDEVWISVSSFTTPPRLYRWDGELSLAKQSQELFDASGLETRQHWAQSADGTQIPYFIVGNFSRGQRPTLVGGYGGFEVSLTPRYSGIRGLGWLERGHYFVQPNLRGGGEFGPAWHSQVVKTNRHKVWEDHEAVLRDVVARGYCRPEQVAIRGGSNGGLLASGALNRYPDAFGAAVVQVPLTDMLRYQEWLAGASWMAEYGDPAVPEERAAIESWSPLHNVVSAEEKPYPPALVTSSTRDDRVHPAHARLFAHALHAHGQPVDYFENTSGGHAGAADNDQVARVESLIFHWLAENVDKQAKE